jgi:hypothetical protein
MTVTVTVIVTKTVTITVAFTVSERRKTGPSRRMMISSLKTQCSVCVVYTADVMIHVHKTSSRQQSVRQVDQNFIQVTAQSSRD